MIGESGSESSQGTYRKTRTLEIANSSYGLPPTDRGAPQFDRIRLGGDTVIGVYINPSHEDDQRYVKVNLEQANNWCWVAPYKN